MFEWRPMKLNIVLSFVLNALVALANLIIVRQGPLILTVLQLFAFAFFAREAWCWYRYTNWFSGGPK